MLFIRDSTITERVHTKVTQEKYKNMIISTITHDMKTPVMAIKGHLDLLPQYITQGGEQFLHAAKLATSSFEYYIYDLIVKKALLLYFY